MSDFSEGVDLASRALGGSVVWATDEFFGDVHTLIDPARPTHDPMAFAARGKVYDGWETRRRRRPGQDEAIVRLAAPTVVHGVGIDTSFFRGNYPPRATVQTTTRLGYPDATQVRSSEWVTVVDRVELAGDTVNLAAVDGEPRLATYVKLVIHPDGGVARFRVYGHVIADPAILGGRIDLAATLHGGRVLDCSNLFFSAPSNVLAPGRAQLMSDGWETARRRDAGNEWLTVALAAPGLLHEVVIDTSRYLGNAPAAARLTDADTSAELLPTTALLPDTEHRFRIRHTKPVSAVRLDIYPDGGISRLRVRGEVEVAARSSYARRWLGLLPPEIAQQAISSEFFQ